ANSPEGVTWAFTLGEGAPSEFELDESDDTQGKVAEALDYETTQSYEISIVATSDEVEPRELTTTITVPVVNVVDDVDAPAIVELIPPDDGTGVLLNSPLIIQFNKPIALGETVLIRLYKTDGDVLVQEWD